MDDRQLAVSGFYGNSYDEDGRMGRNPLEYLRCKEIILRYLADESMEIADIGGATGTFSYWLSQMGHRVHLLDFVPRHIEQAKENGSRRNMRLSSYTCGDARHVPYRDSQFDVVLEMGPLYHLQQEEDRMQCLAQAMRILKDGGVVLCEAISRYANLFEGFQGGLISDDRFADILDENLESGRHTPGETPYFTNAFFHTPSVLVHELEQAGFMDVSLIAVEGFAFAFPTEGILGDPKKTELLLHYIRKTESNPDLLGVTGHFFAVGKKAATRA